MPPADRRRGRQAGTVRVSGPGVGLQLDGGAVQAGGAEQVGGFLAGTSTQAPSGGFDHLDFAHLASVVLNGDVTPQTAAVKRSNLSPSMPSSRFSKLCWKGYVKTGSLNLFFFIRIKYSILIKNCTSFTVNRKEH